jgi:hypothetical protein
MKVGAGVGFAVGLGVEAVDAAQIFQPERTTLLSEYQTRDWISSDAI